jgi:tetratricopeptide (TPR) repeat protein
MDTKQVLARFEAERQALAMMDHPNIAKVLDAGATLGGRPYFAMELVKGVPITEFCRDQKFGPRRRLELFKDVCSAVNHAHQKGIIHRDLKPSNVMVTLHGDKPVPKVIDFGIAKATQQKLTDKTLFTRFEQFLGTPVYMSPEQAAMSGLDIDTRSDIYSLGVLLYELLAGQPPFDPKTLLSAGYDEMRRIIKEDEPPKPSTRLTQSLASPGQDMIHRIPPSALRGELDWIVMRAIDKDRSRRYETANALAADIGRYLINEPVMAAAPSAIYKVRKFARRNKTAFSVAAAITVVLVVATLVSTWQAVKATRAGIESEEARKEAEAISAFLTEVFQSANPGSDGGEREITVAETLGRAVEKLEAEYDDYPERRTKLEATIAETYQGLGKYREAIDLQKKVLAFYKSDPDPGSEELIQAMRTLVIWLDASGQHIEAMEFSEERLQLCRREHGSESPQTLSAIMALLRMRYNAWANGKSERLEDSLTLGKELVALCRKAHGPESKETLDAMHQLAHASVGDESHRLHAEVAALSRKVLGLSHDSTLRAMGCLEASLRERGETAESVALAKQVYEARKGKHGEDYPRTLDTMARLATALEADGQTVEAIALLEELKVRSERVRGPNHPETLKAMDALATLYEGQD